MKFSSSIALLPELNSILPYLASIVVMSKNKNSEATDEGKGGTMDVLNTQMMATAANDGCELEVRSKMHREALQRAKKNNYECKIDKSRVRELVVICDGASKKRTLYTVHRSWVAFQKGHVFTPTVRDPARTVDQSNMDYYYDKLLLNRVPPGTPFIKVRPPTRTCAKVKSGVHPEKRKIVVTWKLWKLKAVLKDFGEYIYTTTL